MYIYIYIYVSPRRIICFSLSLSLSLSPYIYIYIYIYTYIYIYRDMYIYIYIHIYIYIYIYPPPARPRRASALPAAPLGMFQMDFQWVVPIEFHSFSGMFQRVVTFLADFLGRLLRRQVSGDAVASFQEVGRRIVTTMTTIISSTSVSCIMSATTINHNN